jgi:hypothetical protein
MSPSFDTPSFLSAISLNSFLLKHRACKEGRDYCMKIGARTPDEIWEREDLPHHWRLWMFSKTIAALTFIEFSLWVAKDHDLSYCPRAVKALTLIDNVMLGIIQTEKDSANALIEAFWIPKEVARLSWVQAYKTYEHNPAFISLVNKGMTKWQAMNRVCFDAMDAEIVRQVKRMFEITPQIL